MPIRFFLIKVKEAHTIRPVLPKIILTLDSKTRTYSTNLEEDLLEGKGEAIKVSILKIYNLFLRIFLEEWEEAAKEVAVRIVMVVKITLKI